MKIKILNQKVFGKTLLLDSTWIFYDSNGRISLKENYSKN